MVREHDECDVEVGDVGGGGARCDALDWRKDSLNNATLYRSKQAVECNSDQVLPSYQSGREVGDLNCPRQDF